MDDSYPKPVSDPAADGIPEYADDDSTAWDDVGSPREADGPDPYPLPGDREDGPAAVDEYGTTPEEQRRGEPLDLRLSREEPDVSPDALGTVRDAELEDRPDPLLDEAMGGNAAFAAEDASGDGRFGESGLLQALPRLRFYAAAPLITPAKVVRREGAY